MRIENETIKGKNIILRRLQESDAEFLAYWYSQPEIMFQCGFHRPRTLDDELECIRNPQPDRDWYAITDLSGKLIGETGLLRMWHHWHCTDMTLIIPDPAEQGKGYGREVACMILDRAFNHHQMNRVAVGIVGLNTGSVRFYKRLGFKTEGIQEQGYLYDGVYSDFVMMRMLRSEWNI
jgi:RimJ/RimL family protein N-acetyltransferase